MAAILERYQVPNAAGWRALEEHWRQHLKEQPEEREAFERAPGLYVAYVRRLPG